MGGGGGPRRRIALAPIRLKLRRHFLPGAFLHLVQDALAGELQKLGLEAAEGRISFEGFDVLANRDEGLLNDVLRFRRAQT